MMIYDDICANSSRLHQTVGLLAPLQYHAGGTWQCLLPRDPDPFDAETLPGWTPNTTIGWPFHGGK